MPTKSYYTELLTNSTHFPSGTYLLQDIYDKVEAAGYPQKHDKKRQDKNFDE